MNARDRILNAAYRVMKRDGAAAFSLRAVAKAANVTPMAIYKHFENRDALLDALVLDGLAHWETRVRSIKAGTPLERMEVEANEFSATLLVPAPEYREARKGLGGKAVAPHSASKPTVNLYNRGKPAKATVTGNFRLTHNDADNDAADAARDAARNDANAARDAARAANWRSLPPVSKLSVIRKTGMDDSELAWARSASAFSR